MPRKSHFTLRTKSVLLVFFTTAIFIITAGGIASYRVKQNQKQTIKNEIATVAKIVAQDAKVRTTLGKHPRPTETNSLQKYANQITQDSHVDFIVILDQKLIRYSHPDASRIGKQFSSLQDAKKSSTGKIHYSHRKGILGTGYRIFVPVFKSKQQVGIVCVGLTDSSINRAILAAQKSVILGSLFALCIGVILALFLAQHIKKSLFNMEPDEIATKLTELHAIIDSIDEILIAVDNQNTVITTNQLAKMTFPAVKVGKTLDSSLANLLFNPDHSPKKTNIPLLINAKEFIVSTNQLVYHNKTYGQIALLQDQSKYQKLSEQLAGSEQYIQALRAQSHEFRNKLQAIYGMIELKQFDNVTNFIDKVNADYQQEFGQLNQQVESPALVGFLTGKIKQASEQKVTLALTPESYLPQAIISDQLNLDLIKILGNLIDNALAAIEDNGKITLELNYDSESTTLIIEVSDNGCGISPTVQKRLFKQKYSTKGKDHGYGLILVKQLVDNHHGYIDVTPCNPHGSNFYLELPLKVRNTNVENFNCRR